MVAQMKGPGVAPAVTGGLEELGHPSGRALTGSDHASSATFPVNGQRWTTAQGGRAQEASGPDQPAHPRINNAGRVSIGGTEPTEGHTEGVTRLQGGHASRSVLYLSPSGPARLTLN